MRDILRVMTCGSVDDGKSTLMGRLLWESKQIFEDHLSTLQKDSIRYGTQRGAIDLALVVDGLQAEREQSITIDVAYRFFTTSRRRFLFADTPGHEQYTCNMATAASNSELAVLVVNAAKGLQLQTHRHARIVSLLGIRHLVLAVNKMDLIGWNKSGFDDIVNTFQILANYLDLEYLQPIPVSALNGDNITQLSAAAPWYAGPTLLSCLEDVDVCRDRARQAFRMAVQWVNRPNQDFRGYCGRIASGAVNIGDRLCAYPGGMESGVRSIVASRKGTSAAAAGESVTICLDNHIDVSRGTVLSSASDPVEMSDQFEAHLLCLSEHPVLAGRSYLFRIHTCSAVGTITSIKHKLDIKFGNCLAAKSLVLNDIGVVTLSIDRPVAFEPYSRCRRLGAFILIDRVNNRTVAAGMITFALRRAANIRWQVLDVNKEARARLKLQRPVCLWFTGLPGAGKSTIANLLEKRMFASGRHTYILDGDNVRHGLSRDLGFSEADRVENIRRAMEVARLFVDAGVVVIVSFISPYRAERILARSRFEPGEFLEIYVDTPLEECERRDPKGLYAKARRGELVNLTGIDSSYEPPETPDIRLDTVSTNPEDCVDLIMAFLERNRPHKTTFDESRNGRYI